MINDACKLASSGLSQDLAIAVGLIVIILAFMLIFLRKKYAVKSLWILPVFLLLFAITLPIPKVFAIENCTTSATNTSSSEATDNNAVIEGNLVDDSPTLTESVDFPGNYSAGFSVLNNDNAPTGDPFDISTLRLVGNTPYPDWWEGSSYDIYDPNDSNTFWGHWDLDLDCIPGGDYLNISQCPVSVGGTAMIFLNDQVPVGETLTIQYTVKTMSGKQLGPATITVRMPTKIIAQNIDYQGDCFTWDSINIDIMSNITTNGSGTLLPGTIDLDPNTPGRQTSITAYDQTYPSYFTTFTVDENGILTRTAPQSDDGGSVLSYQVSYTIQDSDGFMSNVGLFTYTTISCG